MPEDKELQLEYARWMTEELSDENFKKLVTHLESHFDIQWLVQFRSDSARVVAHRRDIDRRMAEYRKCQS